MSPVFTIHKLGLNTMVPVSAFTYYLNFKVDIDTKAFNLFNFNTVTFEYIFVFFYANVILEKDKYLMLVKNNILHISRYFRFFSY